MGAGLMMGYPHPVYCSRQGTLYLHNEWPTGRLSTPSSPFPAPTQYNRKDWDWESVYPYNQTGCWLLGMVDTACVLGWSESKSDCKFGFSMLKNSTVRKFGAIRATSGVWQHIVIFAWWHVHVISRGSTQYNIYCRHRLIAGSNFRCTRIKKS